MSTESQDIQDIQDIQESETLPMKYAKSMTGHVYAYAVRTAGEFLQKVSENYQVSKRFLCLLEPDEYQEIDAVTGEPLRTIRKYEDESLEEHIVYALLMDTPHPVLLDWIDPAYLNYHLRIQNPSYYISDAEGYALTPDELDYLAMYSERIDIVAQHYQRLTEKGWRRIFLNQAAVPFLEEHYHETVSRFYEFAPLLATNDEAIPLIERLLHDNVAMSRPDIFWRNLTRNKNSLVLLEQHPDMIHYPSLSENANAIPLITRLIDENNAATDRLDWRNLSAHPDVGPLLFRFPHLVSRITIKHNPGPDAAKWIRAHLSVEEIEWDILCRHTDPEFIALVEEYLDHITPEGWLSLCYNPSAVHLLKSHPEKIHWTLLSCNPSAEVVPMIEEYLSIPLSMLPFLSEEGESLIGNSFVRHRIRERYQGKDLWHEDNRLIVNRGALSLHPHALPLLKENPRLIYWNSLSVRPDIYEEPTGSLL